MNAKEPLVKPHAPEPLQGIVAAARSKLPTQAQETLMKSRSILRSALAVTFGLSSGALFGADGVFTLGTGFDYTSGKYGSADKTEILYVPFTGKYETGPWTFRAVVPYI